MKKIVFLSVLLAFASTAAYAQSFQWLRTLQGSVWYHDVWTDNAGNIYTVFNPSTIMDVDAGPGVFNIDPTHGGADVCIVKTTAAGQFLWARNFGTEHKFGRQTASYNGFAVDDSANFYLIGCFGGKMNLTVKGHATILESTGIKPYAMKLDSSGTMQWAVSFGVGDIQDMARDIALDQNGNVLITGDFNNVGDFDPGPGVSNLGLPGQKSKFVLKLSNAGDLIWARDFHGQLGQDIIQVATDAASNVFVAGQMYDSIAFTPGNYVHAPKHNSYLCKFTEDGKFCWSTIRSNPVNNLIYSNDDLYTSHEGEILRVDTQGTTIWKKTVVPAAYQMGFNTDKTGNLYTYGTFYRSTRDFDPGAGTYNLTSKSAHAMFLQKLDENANFIWAEMIGEHTPTTHYLGATDLHIDDSFNLFFTGVYMGEVDFAPGSKTFFGPSDTITSKLFLLKLNASSGNLSTRSVNENDVVSVYPNPGSGALYFQMKNITGATQVKLWNNIGQLVMQTTCSEGIDHIDISQLSPGVYRAEFLNGGACGRTTIVKE